jgi:hypothetical protein
MPVLMSNASMRAHVLLVGAAEPCSRRALGNHSRS